MRGFIPFTFQVNISGDGEQIGFEGFCANSAVIHPGTNEGFGSNILSLVTITSQPKGKPVDICCVGLIELMKVDHDFSLKIICRNLEKVT
jgi:hypothetical protein